MKGFEAITFILISIGVLLLLQELKNAEQEIASLEYSLEVYKKYSLEQVDKYLLQEITMLNDTVKIVSYDSLKNTVLLDNGLNVPLVTIINGINLK